MKFRVLALILRNTGVNMQFYIIPEHAKGTHAARVFFKEMRRAKEAGRDFDYPSFEAWEDGWYYQNYVEMAV